jgi:hypothetical protein
MWALCLDEGAGQQQDIWHDGGDLPGMRLISEARSVRCAVSENTRITARGGKPPPHPGLALPLLLRPEPDPQP